MKKKGFIRLICALSVAAMIATGWNAGSMTGYAKEDTVYSIGSVSKMYVSTAIMQLVDQGKIDLDEKVVTYIPEFQMADERYKDITVRMLLNHTSGLMGTTYADSFLLEDNDPIYHDKQLLENLKVQRLKANPGEFSTYCNDGFDLMEIVVERVSGEDFTDYMTKHIVSPLGGHLTGSYKNMFQNENQVTIYDADGQPFAHEYHIGIGTGGVLSTAKELCQFGSAYFRGNNVLLSEKSKKMMEEDLSKNKYEGHYALGWDDVDVYEGTGVKVVTKGGDLFNQHASLLVAPEEEISVAVCSAGGSSFFNQMLAQSLMDVALDEMGKDISRPETTEYVTMDEVPEEYLAKEGYYFVSGALMKVTFPEGKYVEMTTCDSTRKNSTYYKYVGEGKFVKMLGDVPKGSNAIDVNQQVISFTERENGRTYIVEEGKTELPKLGSSLSSSYLAEKLEIGTVDAKAQKAWKDREGKYYSITGKYSNAYFYAGMQKLEIKLSEELEGYLYAGGFEVIVSENQAKSFINLPGQGGRDCRDITAVKVNGEDAIVLEGYGLTYVKEGNMPTLTSDVKKIDFVDGQVKWYVINAEQSGSVITFDRSEKTAVYIYDEYDNCTYNTYMTGFSDRIPLPTAGKIVFLGEKGENITIE